MCKKHMDLLYIIMYIMSIIGYNMPKKDTNKEKYTPYSLVYTESIL